MEISFSLAVENFANDRPVVKPLDGVVGHATDFSCSFLA